MLWVISKKDQRIMLRFLLLRTGLDLETISFMLFNSSLRRDQLTKWEELRKRYPEIISCCVTNDWVLHSIRAQNKFSEQCGLFRSNCLVFQASNDAFVYNRAMIVIGKTIPSLR